MNARNTYPWDDWTDGIWRAVFLRIHFAVSVESFASRLCHFERETGNDVDVIRLPEQDGLAFRITPGTSAGPRRTDPASQAQRLLRPLTAFVATRCTENPGDSCLADDLRSAFAAHLAKSGRMTGFSPVGFGRALKTVSPDVSRTKRRVKGRLTPVYTGIALCDRP